MKNEGLSWKELVQVVVVLDNTVAQDDTYNVDQSQWPQWLHESSGSKSSGRRQWDGWTVTNWSI